MKIEHTNSETRGYFAATEDNKQAGKLTYNRQGEKTIVIDHTEVDPQFQGKGVGKKLVDGAVEFARTNSLTILPQCSYAKKVLERSSEYKDVLS